MNNSTSRNVNDVIASTLGKSINRRSLVKSIAGIGGVAVLVPALGLLSPTAARSTDSLIVNTAGARLRSGAGTGYGVIVSLARGTEVRYLADGGNANGYRWYKVRVLATGKEGFVSASLLSAPDAGPSGDPVIVGSATTTAAVNLRSGPSTGNQVLRVVPKGAVVATRATGFLARLVAAQDGFQVRPEGVVDVPDRRVVLFGDRVGGRMRGSHPARLPSNPTFRIAS